MKTDKFPISQIAEKVIGRISASSTVEEAITLMKFRHVRYLLVFSDDGVPLGLLRALELSRVDFPWQTSVQEVLRPVAFISAEESVRTASQTLLEKNLSGLILLDEAQQIVGVLTAAELLHLLVQILDGEIHPEKSLISVASMQTLGEIANELNLLGI